MASSLGYTRDVAHRIRDALAVARKVRSQFSSASDNAVARDDADSARRQFI